MKVLLGDLLKECDYFTARPKWAWIEVIKTEDDQEAQPYIFYYGVKQEYDAYNDPFILLELANITSEEKVEIDTISSFAHPYSQAYMKLPEVYAFARNRGPLTIPSKWLEIEMLSPNEFAYVPGTTPPVILKLSKEALSKRLETASKQYCGFYESKEEDYEKVRIDIVSRLLVWTGETIPLLRRETVFVAGESIATVLRAAYFFNQFLISQGETLSLAINKYLKIHNPFYFTGTFEIDDKSGKPYLKTHLYNLELVVFISFLHRLKNGLIEKRICPECRREFLPTHKRQNYCSEQCRKRAFYKRRKGEL